MTDTVDTSKEAVERLAGDCKLAEKVMRERNTFSTGQDILSDAAASLVALAAERDQALARERALLDSNKHRRDHLKELNAVRAERDEWRENFRALEKAIVGDTGLSAMTVAAQARKYRPMYEDARNAALEEAAQVSLNQEAVCAEWWQKTGKHANGYEQLPIVAKGIRALKSERDTRAKSAIAGLQERYRESVDVLNEGSDAPTRRQSVQEAAKVLLENRWGGYGNPRAMRAMCDYVYADRGRMPFPPSFYDGVMQAGLRAIARTQP